MRSIAWKPLSLALLPLAFAAILSGCEPKGPAQKAGENLDKGVSNIKDAVDPRGPSEKLGDKIDKATGAK